MFRVSTRYELRIKKTASKRVLKARDSLTYLRGQDRRFAALTWGGAAAVAVGASVTSVAHAAAAAKPIEAILPQAI